MNYKKQNHDKCINNKLVYFFSLDKVGIHIYYIFKKDLFRKLLISKVYIRTYHNT